MEPTVAYYGGYFGIMEKKMETTNLKTEQQIWQAAELSPRGSRKAPIIAADGILI